MSQDATHDYRGGSEHAGPPRRDWRFGPYVLQDRIGGGGQGEVWRAVQLEPFVRVLAIKLLPPGCELDADRVARLRREAERGGRLAGPSILSVYDYGTVDGRPFLAMPFIDGFSLAEVVAQRRSRLHGSPDAEMHRLAILSDAAYRKETCALLARICRAVADAHAARILHRDIKPANILLAREGGERVYLSDFGLARDLNDANVSLATERGGTPLYMSPERLIGKAASDDFASDVYALGVTLYECLTLRPPFQIPKSLPPASWGTYLVLMEPTPPRRADPSLPRDLESVVLKAMERNPSLRYATAAELGNDLERFVRGEPVLARPAGPVRRTLRRLVRRRRLLNAIAAASLVILTLGMVRLGLAGYAARLRATARGLLASERYVEAGRLASRAQGLDAGNPDNLALLRAVAETAIAEAQSSLDGSNVDQAVEWYRAWVDLDASVSGEKAGERRKAFARGLGLLKVDVFSDRENTRVALHAVRGDGRPRNREPLYEFEAISPLAPTPVEEIVDGLYWVTAEAPDGAFVEYLYQPPPGAPTSPIPPLTLHPRTTAEATKGMALVKGGRLIRRTEAGYDGLAPSTADVDDFYLDTAETTQEEFAAYLDAIHDATIRKRLWPDTLQPDPAKLGWPVTNVTYAEAAAYCAFQGCRLPSDDELEWTARGEQGRTVPPSTPAGWRPTEEGGWFKLHPVRSKPLDRVEVAEGVAIYGLFANAGEITLFRFRPNSFDIAKSRPLPLREELYRRRAEAHEMGGFPVRSGLVPSAGSKTFQLFGYTRLGVLMPEKTEPSIGFRRARSIRPRVGAGKLER